MRKAEHVKFAKFVAKNVYNQETERLGIGKEPFRDLCAEISIDWIGNNIGMLPDLIEPAVNQYHRRLFHSKDVYRKIDEVKAQIQSNPSKNWQSDIFLLMALSAYQSHIFLDSKTPMGAPDYQWVGALLKAFKNS